MISAHHHRRPPAGVKRPDPVKLARLALAHTHPRVAAALSQPLPKATNLTKNPVTDQGQSSSCTAHALVKGVEIVTGFKGSEHVIYSMSGALENTTADNGRQLVDCLTVVRTMGLAPFEGASPDGRNSDIWTAVDTQAKPPNVSTPATAAEVSAAREHMFDLGQTTIDPSSATLSDTVVACLATGSPIYLGTQVGNAFEDIGNGAIAQPDPANDPNAGGHALLIVGVRTNSDGTRDFFVQNSWGEDWSGSGECWASLAWVAACWELHPLLRPSGSAPAKLSLWQRFVNFIKGV